MPKPPYTESCRSAAVLSSSSVVRSRSVYAIRTVAAGAPVRASDATSCSYCISCCSSADGWTTAGARGGRPRDDAVTRWGFDEFGLVREEGGRLRAEVGRLRADAGRLRDDDAEPGRSSGWTLDLAALAACAGSGGEACRGGAFFACAGSGGDDERCGCCGGD